MASTAAGSRTTPGAPTSSHALSMPAARRGCARPGRCGGSGPSGSRSATSEGRSKLPNRTDMLSVSGRSTSSAIQVDAPADLIARAVNEQPARREPVLHQPPDARHVGFLVLPQHVERAHQDGLSRPPAVRSRPRLEAEAGPFKRLGRRTRSGSISMPQTRTSGPDARRGVRKVRRRWPATRRTPGRPPGVGRGAQPPGLRPGQPAVHAAHPVGVGGAAGTLPTGRPRCPRFQGLSPPVQLSAPPPNPILTGRNARRCNARQSAAPLG